MPATAPRITPDLTDDNRDFWTSGADGELRIPYCESCARWIFPIEAVCPTCSTATVPRAVSGRGTVYTYTVNHQPFHPDVAPPYALAIVELDDQADLRFMTNLVNCDLDAIEIGMAVHLVIEQHGEVFVPLFEPASG